MKLKAPTVFLLLTCSLLIPTSLDAQVSQAPPKPVLSIAPESQPYTLAKTCERGKPLVTINVVVTNTGSQPVLAQLDSSAIVARDESKPAWAGGAPLPALAAGTSAKIAIPVLPSWKPQAIAGTHRFTVTADLYHASAPVPIVVNVPGGLCGALATSQPKIIHLGQRGESVQGSPARPATGGGPSSSSSSAPALTMASPTGLTSTVDQQVCTQHGGFGGGLACKALLPQGRLALVWMWQGGAVDGFRVYDVSGGQRIKVGTQENGKDVTIFIVDPVPQGGYQGKCYAVSAYKGSLESDPSDPFCVGAGRVVQVAAFQPQHMRAIAHWIVRDTGVITGYTHEGYDDTGGLAAGFKYVTHKYITDTSVNEIWRLALHFDLSSVSHKNIRSARLKLTVDTTTSGSDYRTDHHTSCAARIGTGMDYWWNHNDWIDGGVVLQPGVYQGPDVAYDVTQIVRGWAGGSPNFGFVLLGEEENLGAFTEKSCSTTYVADRVQLEVEYF